MKGRTSNNVQSKRSAKNGRRDLKPQQANGAKRLAEKESKPTAAKDESNVSVASDSTTQSEPSEVCETTDVHNVDGGNGSKDAHHDSDSGRVMNNVETINIANDPYCDLEKGGGEEGLDSETSEDSKTTKTANVTDEKGFEDVKTDSVSLPEVPEGIDVSRSVEEVREEEIWEDASNGALSVGSENEAADVKNHSGKDDAEALEQKIEDLKTRIEKLEEELREVAALEISLYSVVPDHASSAHKLHTPARRLSRLYIHACKHWTQSKRASIARNIVSGLILVAKSCGNDVSRLTFWLSNAIALREIISQAFGTSRISSPFAKISESNGKPINVKWKKSIGSKQSNGFVQFFEDWQETGTFITALEKVESWVFSRIVESVWWQVFTPHMQSPEDSPSVGKTNGNLIGSSLSDQQQGSISVNLWKNAFQEALQRLCPIRGGGHECGCLSILARMVMEQCIARLDVAMFNAILRESQHQIPTDPVSDPILDSKVLPIPAGDLSFGSGAQLKNTIGNWSRWLTDMFGMDSGDSVKEEQRSENDSGDGECKSFLLLNDLSDLLMLPKDMLVDRSIREEVCPSISLPLIKRILCNFTPDEFCPDHVPGAVLEALNAESIVERTFSGDSSRGFPYTASPVYYSPPSSADVAEKVAEAGGMSYLSRNVSMIQRKGYTSDEELEELDSPLTSIIDKVSLSPTPKRNGHAKHSEHIGSVSANARYELLREVWSM